MEGRHNVKGRPNASAAPPCGVSLLIPLPFSISFLSSSCFYPYLLRWMLPLSLLLLFSKTRTNEAFVFDGTSKCGRVNYQSRSVSGCFSTSSWSWSSSSSSLSSYLRIQRSESKDDDTDTPRWQLQTAIQSFEKLTEDGRCCLSLDLHAMVHLADEFYYRGFEDAAFNDSYDLVFYELLVDEDLLRFVDNDNGGDGAAAAAASDGSSAGDGGTAVARARQLAVPVRPTLEDVATARRHGLVCQLDALDIAAKNSNSNSNGDDDDNDESGRRLRWIHADLTRGELGRMLRDGEGGGSTMPTRSNSFGIVDEILGAVVRPTTPATMGASSLSSSSSSPSSSKSLGQRHSHGYDYEATRTKLFTNLFWTGEGISRFLRGTLWLTVPSPELSVLLLDWGVTRGGGRLSPVAPSVFRALLRGDVKTAGTLVFAQMLVSGQADDGRASVLVGARNDRALEILLSTSSSSSSLSSSTSPPLSSSLPNGDDHCRRRSALLYGALHCRDLESKLIQEYGYTKMGAPRWRTAWSVDPPKKPKEANVNVNVNANANANTKGRTNNVPDPVAALAIVAYLVVGALDWTSAVRDLAKVVVVALGWWWNVDGNGNGNGNGLSYDVDVVGDAIPSVALYILRHVALYFSLAKFVVQWDMGLFEMEPAEK